MGRRVLEGSVDGTPTRFRRYLNDCESVSLESCTVGKRSSRCTSSDFLQHHRCFWWLTRAVATYSAPLVFSRAAITASSVHSTSGILCNRKGAGGSHGRKEPLEARVCEADNLISVGLIGASGSTEWKPPDHGTELGRQADRARAAVGKALPSGARRGSVWKRQREPSERRCGCEEEVMEACL